MKNIFKAVLFMLVLVLSAAFVSAGADPVLNSVSDQFVNEGTLLQIFLSTTAGPDSGPFTNFSVCQVTAAADTLCSGTPSKISITIGSTVANITNISNTQGQFNWTPSFAQAGTFFFLFNASDADSQSFKIGKVTVVDVPPKLTVTGTLTLGGDSQERSDPNHDTDDKREVNVTGTITVKNDGPEQLNNLNGVVSVASGFTASDLTVNFTLPKTTLAVGESISVPVSVRVPQKLDGVNRALSAVAVNVATITFSATPAVTGGSISGATQLALRAENNLKIKDVKVRFDGKSETVDDGDTVDDMKPGMSVEFEIEIENRFKEKEDVDIEDIEVKVVSNGELDIDEDEDAGDLGAEDKDTIKLSSVIDDEADDGTFNVEISVEGTDEFGARHGEKIKVNFEIKRKSHEIEIKSLTLNPPTVSCDKETRLTANIRNSGRRDEEEVFVSVASPELQFGARSDKLEIDEDDEDSVSFTIPVPESTPRPANYRITVDTFFNTGTKSNSEVALLSVAKCGAVKEEEKEEAYPPAEEKKEEITVVTVPPAQVNVTTPAQPAAKKPFVETPQYLALLALGYIAVLGGGAAILIKLVQRP